MTDGITLPEPNAQGPIIDKIRGLFGLIAAVPGFIGLIRQALELRDFTLEKEGFFVWLGKLAALFTEGAKMTETTVDDDIAAFFAEIIANRELFDGLYFIVELFIGGADDEAVARDTYAFAVRVEPETGASAWIIITVVEFILMIVRELRKRG